MSIISTVIPAYNEANTIGNIIKVLSQINEIHEIIVVSDGSKDNTAQVARKNGAKVIELHTNIGKGGAIKTGIDNCNSDIILLLDADLIGLTKEHVKKLLNPVVSGEVGMSVGEFCNGRFTTDLAQKISPLLSGQRAVRTDIIKSVNNLEMSKFGIEVAINNYVRKNNIKYKIVLLENMSHVMKEEKMGFRKGMKSRIKMYWDIIKSLFAKYK